MLLTPRADARRANRRSSRKRVWVGALVFLVLAVILLAAWVGIRGYLAQRELSQVAPLASQLKSQIVEGDSAGAVLTANKLAERTHAAAGLTSDPIWMSMESIPWLGSNLRVVRELAAAADHVATKGVTPLSELAGTISLTDFEPKGGRIDLQPMVDAQSKLAAASSVLAESVAEVDAIDDTGTLEPIVDAHQKLSGALDEANESLSIIESASRLIPAMLGRDGPRNYLVLFQNNAELRSTGGIPGAMALISTDNGTMSLAQQASSRDFPKFDSPVLDLPIETRAIYGDNTAQYIQDVTFTPNFPLSAQIARQMWSQRFGTEVDGVISLDPVALSYLLEATGPISLPTGDQLTSDNAVQLLLQDVYSRYESSADQDLFFASAAAAVFDRIASGDVSLKKLVSSLSHASEERRVLMWSSHAEDQAVVATTTLAGSLPVSDSKNQAFGVYFNDATAAKMDPYLQIDIESSHASCRNDGIPNYAVRVTMTNVAPADAEASLPGYVTGGGVSGAPIGSIRTNVSVYGAPGTFNLGALRDGLPTDYHPASDDGYTLSKLQVELAPGQTAVLDFQFLGDAPGLKQMLVEHTPLVYSIETKDVEFSCESALQ